MTGTPLPTDDLPFVSVVIPTFNREQVLCDTIEHILAQDYPHFEVIVVDQTTTRELSTQTYLQERATEGRIRYFFCEPPNVCRAINFGVNVAKGSIVVFLDDDVVPSPSLLRSHAIAHMTRPDIGGVAGGVIVAPGMSQVEDFVMSEQDSIGDSARYATYAVGCNSSYRVDVLKSVGLLDEGFVKNSFMWEKDLAIRIEHIGERILYVKDASVVHLRVPTGGCRSWNENGVQGYFTTDSFYYNVSRCYLKHYPVWRAALEVMRNGLNAFNRRAWFGFRDRPWVRLYPLRRVPYAVRGFVNAYKALASERAGWHQ